MLTVADALRRISRRLDEAGIDSSGLDARILTAALLGIEPRDMFGRSDLALDGEQLAKLENWVERRAAREPVSRILGRRGFWTLELGLGPDTLDPRPDSETVVEAVLDAIPDRRAEARILDFGTGTGCLLLAILSELPAAWGLGVDRSLGALAVARANAEALDLGGRAAFALADWGRGIDGRFNVIVANPPYIPEDDIEGLEPEVAQYDPRLALAGGLDGLDCYRRLAPHMARLAAEDGVIAVEVGQGQARSVAEILEQSGLRISEIRRDLGGVERCVIARSGGFEGGAKNVLERLG